MLRKPAVLVLCLALSACGSTPAPEPQAVAACIAKDLDAGAEESLGLRADPSKPGFPVHLRRFDNLGCRGARAIFDTDAALEAQGLALSALLSPKRQFRVGLQEVVWRGAGQTSKVAQALANLAVQSGSEVVLRAWGTSCKLITDAQADRLRELEAPYLTAYVGTRGWVADAKGARLMASNIAAQGQPNALQEAGSAAAACSDVGMSARLKAHQEAVNAFELGVNAMVPGCQAVADGAEFVLSCKGS